jgi:hypothetical protein
VRIIGEPLADVVGHDIERVVLPAAANARLALAVEVGTDGLTVSIQMPGDRRDRPALLAERMRFHIFLRCHHGAGSS